MAMRRKTVQLIVILALVLLTAPLAANAQPSPKVYRIGWLNEGRPPSGPTPSIEAFQQGLRDLGYVEGQNLAIEYRYAEGNTERLRDLAAELVGLKVDVIVTSGTPATLAAKQATRMIPIIMAVVGVDAVEAGLVASLARPEGNVTELATSSAELWGKRLELLREAVPRLSRLAILWDPANPGNAFCVREVKAVALAMGVTLQLLEVRDANAFEHAFAKMALETPDALAVCWSTPTLTYAKPIADFAVQSHLPMVAPIKAYVQAGSLMAYGPSLSHQLRRVPYYVDKILKGTKPADLSVEQPMQFELVINLKTAQALGLTLPATLLFQATEVIQ